MTPNFWILLLMFVLGAACTWFARVRTVTEDLGDDLDVEERTPVAASPRAPAGGREHDHDVDVDQGPVTPRTEPIERLRTGASAATERVRLLFRRPVRGDAATEPVAHDDDRGGSVTEAMPVAERDRGTRPEPLDADPMDPDDVPDESPLRPTRPAVAEERTGPRAVRPSGPTDERDVESRGGHRLGRPLPRNDDSLFEDDDR